MRGFGFRVACYREFGWTPETVAKLTESEALKLAIMFEETWAYERKRLNAVEHSPGGLQEGFEEDFTFGEDDPNDYWDRPDITEGQPLKD